MYKRQENTRAQTRRCQLCQHEVSAKAVVCVHCGGNPQTGAPPARKNALARDRKSHQIAPIGLKFTQAGLLLSLMAVILYAASFVMGFLTSWYDIPDRVLSLVGYLNFGASFIGALLCIATPKESRGRACIIASLIATVGSGFLDILPNADDSLLLTLASAALSIAATVCLLLFFIRLAEYIDFPEITAQAHKTLTIYIALMVSLCFIWIPIFNCIIGILALGLAIYSAVLYLLLIIDLNRGVACRIREGGV